MKCIPVAVLVTLSVCGLQGQSSAILPGDPDVFAAFLRMHHAVVSSVGQTGTAADSSGTPAIPPAMAWQRDLGISDADFGKIDAFYVQLKSQIDALRSEAISYASEHSTNADSAILNSFHDREVAMITAAAANLRRQLSAAGATSLFGFIDGRFRASVSRTPIRKAN
jgi:hypothetical protein